MKYVFFLLVLVNILFYLWETGPGRNPSKDDDANMAGERIQLFNESPSRKPAQTQPDEGSVLTAIETAKPQASQVAAEPAVAGTGQPAQPQASPPEHQTAEEKPGQEPVQTNSQPTEGKVSEPGSEKPQTCYRLGPFISQSRAQAAAKEFSQYQTETAKIPTEIETGYMVYYPPAKDLQTALDNLKMLKEKGFADAFIINQEDLRFVVSLAMVHKKELAELAIERNRAKGIELELKPRIAQADRWWLLIRGATEPRGLPAIKPPAGSPAPSIKRCD